MTKMTEEERIELVAAMSNKTEMGRMTAGEINSCFDRMVEMGYDIVKWPPHVEAPVKEPVKPLVPVMPAKPFVPEPKPIVTQPEHAGIFSNDLKDDPMPAKPFEHVTTHHDEKSE